MFSKKTAVAVLAAALIPGVLGFANSASAHNETEGNPFKTSLTVTMSNAAGETFQAKLKCEPPRGTHPNAAAACKQLMEFVAKDEDPFKPVPAGSLCGMSFRPGDATVKGTLFGQQIDAKFSGRNTCEQARWDRLDQLINIGK